MAVVVESGKVKMVKVKFALEQALTAQSLSRRIALLFKLGPRLGWVVHVPPRLLYCRYPLYRRLGRRQARSGWVRKISPPPGFNPRTVQPVASRYTD